MTDQASNMTTAPPRARRFKTFHLAEMRLMDTRVKVHVVNLSTSGLMLRSEAAPSPGTIAIFDLGAAERRGRVVWCDQDRCGVQFLVPLTDSELDALMVPSATTQSPARAALKRLGARLAVSRA